MNATTQSGFAEALLDPAQPIPRARDIPHIAFPAARFAIHRNNVVASLVDALGDTFPVVAQLVGDEFFRAMASAFVRASPPRTRVLATWGDAFADFIEAFEPARALPYLSDVARLEHARVVSYHAADADGLSREAVLDALASREDASAWTFGCHPSLATLTSRHAVVSLWAAHQRVAIDLSTIEIERAESCWITRDGLEVVVLPVPPAAAVFVRALLDDAALGAAAADAFAIDPRFDLVAALVLLVRHGALVSIEGRG